MKLNIETKQLFKKYINNYIQALNQVYKAYSENRMIFYSEIEEKLEAWEADKEKYHCWNCDYDLNNIDPEWYKEFKLTEKLFKNKQCPYCKHHLSYNPRYDNFNIQKYIIDRYGFDCKMVYEAVINGSLDDDIIKERFGYSKEYNLRKPNTKIEIKR